MEWKLRIRGTPIPRRVDGVGPERGNLFGVYLHDSKSRVSTGVGWSWQSQDPGFDRHGSRSRLQHRSWVRTKGKSSVHTHLPLRFGVVFVQLRLHFVRRNNSVPAIFFQRYDLSNVIPRALGPFLPRPLTSPETPLQDGPCRQGQPPLPIPPVPESSPVRSLVPLWLPRREPLPPVIPWSPHWTLILATLKTILGLLTTSLGRPDGETRPYSVLPRLY